MSRLPGPYCPGCGERREACDCITHCEYCGELVELCCCLETADAFDDDELGKDPEED